MSLVQFENLSPFVEMLGVEIVQQSADEVETRMPALAVTQNRKGDVHGGAIATLLDTSMGVAARADMDERAASSTLSLTVSYLNPGRGELRCTARCTKRGRSIRFLEAKVHDRDGVVVATAVATFKVFAGNA